MKHNFLHTARPQLATQLRLYRDGKLVLDGGARPYDPRTQKDPKQVLAGGSIKLGAGLTPCEYALQVIVTDSSPKRRSNWRRAGSISRL